MWKQAYYNASNCEALVSCAAELQGLVLDNAALAAKPTLMSTLLEAVTEVKEFIATFSERGWLSRLEWVSSDKEEFCRLDRLLISVAVEGGNQPGPEQVSFLRLLTSAALEVTCKACHIVSCCGDCAVGVVDKDASTGSHYSTGGNCSSCAHTSHPCTGPWFTMHDSLTYTGTIDLHA